MWIPAQTSYHRELVVADYLKKKGIKYYIPMRYDAPDLTPPEERVKYPLVPAIHNLLFLYHDYDLDWCHKLATDAPCLIYFMKEKRGGVDYVRIPDRVMENFITATDPTICGTRYLSVEEMRVKKGQRVRVCKGSLTGIVGRFVRYGNRHYVAIELSTACALLRIRYSEVERIEDEE